MNSTGAFNTWSHCRYSFISVASSTFWR